MKMMGVTILTMTAMLLSSTLQAESDHKKVQYRKTQDVNFDGMDVDGTVRNPDGAYLVQKRGVDFIPLYQVRKNFDDNMKESVEHLR
jgi:ethanolamine utilization protein EutP (predicted NTPase)